MSTDVLAEYEEHGNGVVQQQPAYVQDRRQTCWRLSFVCFPVCGAEAFMEGRRASFSARATPPIAAAFASVTGDSSEKRQPGRGLVACLAPPFFLFFLLLPSAPCVVSLQDKEEDEHRLGATLSGEVGLQWRKRARGSRRDGLCAGLSHCGQ